MVGVLGLKGQILPNRNIKFPNLQPKDEYWERSNDCTTAAAPTLFKAIFDNFGELLGLLGQILPCGNIKFSNPQLKDGHWERCTTVAVAPTLFKSHF